MANRWSLTEDTIIRNRYTSDGPDAIANELGRTRKAVWQRARVLGVARTNRKWTASDDAILRREYPEKGATSLAERFDVSPAAIHNRAAWLGIVTKSRSFPRRRTQPMQPSSYRAAANTIRAMTNQLEARADAETPRERASRTSVIHRLARYCKHLSNRNRL